MVTRRQNMTQIVADVFAIIDAHFYTLANGKIGLNLIRTPGGGLTLLDASKLTEAPQLDPDGWAETINALTIAYSDAAQDYNEATAQYIDRGNYEITGITRTQMLQRPWITSQALAQKVALSAGARAAMPQMRVSLSARKSVGKTLIPGTAIQLTWAEQGLAAATLRVTEQTLPKPGEAPVVKLSAELDRSYLNADYFAPLHAPTFPLSGNVDGVSDEGDGVAVDAGVLRAASVDVERAADGGPRRGMWRINAGRAGRTMRWISTRISRCMARWWMRIIRRRRISSMTGWGWWCSWIRSRTRLTT
jgi:hypothetical protein